VLSATALALALFALDQAREYGWTSASAVRWAIPAAFVTVLASVGQRRSRAPLLPRRLIRDRVVLVADSCALLAGAALLSIFFFLSLQLQQVWGRSPLVTALAYLPLIGGLLVGAGAASALLPRLGLRSLMATGLLACGLGAGWLAAHAFSMSPGTYARDLLPGLIFTGVGLGLAFVTMTTVAIPGGEGSDGVASGLYNTALQVGGAVGLAIFAAVAAGSADHARFLGAAPLDAVSSGRSAAMMTASIVLLAGALLALRLPRLPPRENGHALIRAA